MKVLNMQVCSPKDHHANIGLPYFLYWSNVSTVVFSTYGKRGFGPTTFTTLDQGSIFFVRYGLKGTHNIYKCIKIWEFLKNVYMPLTCPTARANILSFINSTCDISPFNLWYINKNIFLYWFMSKGVSLVMPHALLLRGSLIWRTLT